jgi:hypothetical protein
VSADEIPAQARERFQVAEDWEREIRDEYREDLRFLEPANSGRRMQARQRISMISTTTGERMPMSEELAAELHRFHKQFGQPYEPSDALDLEVLRILESG